MKKQKWYYTTDKTGKSMKAPSASPFFDGGSTIEPQQNYGGETTSTSQGNQNNENPVTTTQGKPSDIVNVGLGNPIQQKTPTPTFAKPDNVGNNSTQPVTESTDNSTLYLIVGALAVLYFLKGN